MYFGLTKVRVLFVCILGYKCANSTCNTEVLYLVCGFIACKSQVLHNVSQYLELDVGNYLSILAKFIVNHPSGLTGGGGQGGSFSEKLELPLSSFTLKRLVMLLTTYPLKS